MINFGFLRQPAASVNNTLELIKAFTPILVALFGFWAAYMTARYAIKRGLFDKRYEYAGVILNHRIRQIIDFYAPMEIYIEKSRLVYKRLKLMLASEGQFEHEGQTFIYDPETFRLINWGGTLHQIDKYKGFINEILAIGKKMTDLIAEQGGLIEGGVTKIYKDYQGHYSILKNVISANEPIYQGPDLERYQYYPRLLNREVHEGYKTVLKKVNEYIDAGDKNIFWVLNKKKPEVSSLEELQNLINNLEYYENHIDSYTTRFEHTNLSSIYDKFTKELERTRGSNRAQMRILDVACGPGRDTQYFISEGFSVLAFDASPAMRSKCKQRISSKAAKGNEIEKEAAKKSDCLELSFEEIDYQDEFDGIWAAAAFVHVPEYELGQVIERLGIALKQNGILYISLKNGKGIGKFLNRTFHYYNKRKIRNIIGKIPYLRISGDVWLTEDKDNNVLETTPRFLDRNNKKYWINILIRKL